ncbi:hypothetical protein LINPERPRIM_LOCUS25017 [Linum perenne]
MSRIYKTIALNDRVKVKEYQVKNHEQEHKSYMVWSHGRHVAIRAPHAITQLSSQVYSRTLCMV